MREFFKRLRLAYLKWRHPLKRAIRVVRPQPSVEDLAKAYVRQEFERLLAACIPYETVHIPLISVSRPDDANTEYNWQWSWPGKKGREWQSVTLRIKHIGMLRVIAGVDIKDPIFLTVVAHRTSPIEVNISSLLYASAEDPVTIWVFSSQPFEVEKVYPQVRLSADLIANFRQRMLEEEGCCASIPAPDSMEGRRFSQKFPEMLP